MTPIYTLTEEVYFFHDVVIIHQADQDDDVEIPDEEVLTTPDGGVISWPTPYYNIDIDEDDEDDEKSYYAGLGTPKRLDFTNI